MQYSLIKNEDGTKNITVFAGGKVYPARSDHPNFDRILEGVLADDDSVVELFDIASTVAKRFEKVSERVSVANGRVYFDGDEVDNVLTKQIVRFLNEGYSDWIPLVNFFENVQQNPQEYSREQLYNWLDARDFTITPDGLIVGYKSVYSNGDGTFRSTHSGPAVVNGEAVNGYVQQTIDDVVEMPRTQVAFDPGAECSTGLHIGTFDYAENFSGDTILEVHVNPRDVVSVPQDSGSQKMRACRYTVVSTIDKPYDTAMTGYAEYDDDEYDDSEYYEDTFYCEECDGEFNEDEHMHDADDRCVCLQCERDLRAREEADRDPQESSDPDAGYGQTQLF